MSEEELNAASTPETPEVAEVESEVQEENAEVLKTKVGELETVRESLQSKLNEAEEGIKVHQRGSQKAKEELKKIQDFKGALEAQDGKIDTLGAMMAEWMDKSNEGEETDKQTYKERFKANQVAQALRAAEVVCRSFQERAEATGLPQEDPRVLRVRTLVTTATNSEQVKVADGLMKELEALPVVESGKKTEEKVVSEDERIEAEVSRQLHEAKIAAGLLEGEPAGVASSGGKRTFSQSQISDRKFWEANREDILKAQEDGRIID